jgi:hypothetical protein
MGFFWDFMNLLVIVLFACIYYVEFYYLTMRILIEKLEIGGKQRTVTIRMSFLKVLLRRMTESLETLLELKGM